MPNPRIFAALTKVSLLVPLLLSTVGTRAAAQSETVLHAFSNHGAEEINAGVIFDSAGNLYGTTLFGGGGSCSDPGPGCGTVFELSPQAGGGWTEKVIHIFENNGKDGNHPWAGLVFDTAGNLYGATYAGGVYGYGAVFELSPGTGGGWGEKILHNFNNTGVGGYAPFGILILDSAGNLYGTASAGGTYGGGTVFELTQKATGSWPEIVLHAFGRTSDGKDPVSNLTFDSAGNLYGTTYAGGGDGGNAGIVFELIYQTGPGWSENILHRFHYTNDGYSPNAGVVFDTAGNLYGTTVYSGGGYGAVFELSPAAYGFWTETLVHNFGSTEGNYPWSGLLIDSNGNLYGTTTRGGAVGVGTLFEISPTAHGWDPKLIYQFGQLANLADGAYPYATPILDSSGNLYGTTYVGGGHNGGSVFEFTP